MTERLLVCQAQERIPGVALASLGSAIVHIIVERLETPSKWVTAACGNSGFHEDTIAEDDLVCMRCLAAHERGGER